MLVWAVVPPKAACTVTVPLRVAVKVVVALPEASVVEEVGEKVPLPVPLTLQVMVAPFTGFVPSRSVAVSAEFAPLLMLDGVALILRW